ncbi:MAG: hypothetical protein ACKV2T_15755 [Kofleriaceae bacterium]
MSRIALVFATAAAIAGCTRPEPAGTSRCDGVVDAPDACQLACDPSPAAPNTCPSGFHCTPDGFCDQFCAPNSAECGDGYVCTADGRCVDDGTVDPNGPDAACPAVVFNPTPKTPSIGLVLDQSGSMLYGLINNSADPTDPAIQAQRKAACAADPNCRLTAMRSVLTGATGVVTQLQSKAYFGSSQYTCDKEFPDATSALQLIDAPRALNNATAIDSALGMVDATNSWNTPTFAAIDAMVADFVANPPPADSPPAIILATDGLPTNCATGAGVALDGNGNPGDATVRKDAVVAAAQRAYNTAAGGFSHIPLYVLALNLDNTHFQEVANVGQGRPRGTTGPTAIPYYTTSNATDLQNAFLSIINGVLSCDLSLTQAIDMTLAANGTVTLNGQTLTFGSDWILVDPTTIRLQGAACTTLKTAMNPNIMASFPCEAVLF